MKVLFTKAIDAEILREEKRPAYGCH